MAWRRRGCEAERQQDIAALPTTLQKCGRLPRAFPTYRSDTRGSCLVAKLHLLRMLSASDHVWCSASLHTHCYHQFHCSKSVTSCALPYVGFTMYPVGYPVGLTS